VTRWKKFRTFTNFRHNVGRTSSDRIAKYPARTAATYSRIGTPNCVAWRKLFVV